MAIFITSLPTGKRLTFQRAYSEIGNPTYDEVGLFQKNILTRDQFYITEFNISTLNAGLGTVDVALKSFEAIHTFNTTGKKVVVDKAITETLFLLFSSDTPTVSDIFRLIGIDYIYIRPVPTYVIKRCEDDSIVKEFEPAELTQQDVDGDLGNILKLDIDITGLPYDVYYVEFVDEGVTYRTEAFDLQLIHECTLQLTWSDVGNPFNFNYTDVGGYIQSLRVEAKLGKPKYAYDRNEFFVDSKGNRLLTYVRQDKTELMNIAEMPEYCHNALALGLKHSSFQVDGKEYVYQDDEYAPTWRKSSENAPVEVELRRQDVNLVKSNC